MRANVVIKSERFNRALADLRRIGGDEVLKPQARLLVKELIQKTPPLKAKGAASDRAAGINAVTRDLRKAVKPLDAEDFKSPTLRKLIAKRDAAHMQAALRNIRDNPRIRVEPFSADLHRSARDRSTGKVRKSRGILTLDGKAWKAYLKKLTSKVGMLKASWRPAADKVGLSIAGWIRRHSTPRGYVEDKLKHKLFPSFTAVSFGAGVVGHMRHVLKRALEGRAKAIEGNVRHQLRLRAKRNGL